VQIRNFWVDIQNSSGARVGAGPLRASMFRVSSKLSAAGTFSFVVSASDPNLSALQEKRVAVCKYVDINGDVQEFGSGIIDKITRQINQESRLELHVSGNNLARELHYRSVAALDLSGVGGAGVDNAPEQIMALAPAGWTINNGKTAVNVYAGFNGESVLAALAHVGEYIGEHWRLGAGRVIEWLGTADTFVASGVRAIQHLNDPVAAETAPAIAIITSLEEESDAVDVLTRIIPRGSGNGGVMLTLSAVTESPPVGYTLNAGSNYLKRDDSENTYGRIERALDFKDIKPISNTTLDIQAAANMLLQASVEHLRRYGMPQKFYRVSLSKVDQLLQPGTTLPLVYRVLVDGVVIYDLNDTFNILEVENEITNAGAHTTAVMVSTIDRLPQSDSDFLAQNVQAGRVITAHQQLGASVDTFTYRDEMDNFKGASFRFWTGDEYTSIQRAVLRFRIQPLRSTVKSVAGESTTTSSGGGSTSGSGGGTTPTSGPESASHAHGLSIGAGTIVYDVGLTALGALVANAGWGGGTVNAIQNNSVNHNHTVTVPAHTHSTPNHTHALTPNITTVYGIFEESGGNTLALADLVIKLNGGADLNADVVDIGNGWYELDITEELVDEVFRPSQENNEIAITTSVAKTARIEGQITVRGVIQAVAYG